MKKKSILENQYFDTISIFKNCDFIIDNTQFKNFPTDKKRFKEIELVNNTNKDIIVIWFSANGTAYSFLSHSKTVKLTPYAGTLMLYAGRQPQNSSQVNSNPKFRFKEFTKNDSLLLQKEINLNSIEADGIQYEVVEEEGEVKIKS
ncbi:hypothetical protein [Crocinitomix catalasitica]|uniref:hypothetical protein n=1 Tax=Crocinitomix catalasitica TaxID=184607 RepID=UPI0012F8ECFD|nr:hypothetical protein [Crocinitomix catalasitica]